MDQITKKKTGPKPREWTDSDRTTVRRMAMIGIPQDVIAKVLATTKETLEKYFREELDEAMTKANAAVAGALFKNAMKGNVSAQIFWCKTRLGWRETMALDHSGSINITFPDAPGGKD